MVAERPIITLLPAVICLRIDSTVRQSDIDQNAKKMLHNDTTLLIYVHLRQRVSPFSARMHDDFG